MVKSSQSPDLEGRCAQKQAWHTCRKCASVRSSVNRCVRSTVSQEVSQEAPLEVSEQPGNEKINLELCLKIQVERCKNCEQVFLCEAVT